MYRRVAALFAVAALSLGAAACSDDDDPTLPVDQTTTSTAAEPTSTTLSNGPAASPQAAADGLLAAWEDGDKEAASRFARPRAINAIFAHPNTNDVTYENQGCNPEGGQFRCSWTYPGGSMHMTVEGVLGTNGFVVDNVTYVAD